MNLQAKIPNSLISLISNLRNFWHNYDQGQYIEMIPYDKPMGAGTYHPATVFGCFKPNSFVHYVQPSRRPKDARKGQNSARLYIHHQYQVFSGWHKTNLRPKENLQRVVYRSLNELGITDKYLQWKENNWNSTALGAYGKGWELLCNGVEIAQVTYFDKMGGIELVTPNIDYCNRPTEITYGLERILMILGKMFWEKNIEYNKIRELAESTLLDLDILQERLYEKMINTLQYAEQLIKIKMVAAAYDQYLDANNDFNNLDAAGLLGNEKRGYIILLLKNLANKCCNEVINAYS